MNNAETTYRSYDTTTEWMGPIRTSLAAAEADAIRHNAGCAAQGGYGSAIVIQPDRDGYATQVSPPDTDWDGRGGLVWPPHGRSTGAVRFA